MTRSIALALGSVAALMDADAPNRSGGGSIPDPKDESTSSEGGGTGTAVRKDVRIDDEDITVEELNGVVHNSITLRGQLSQLALECDANPGLMDVLRAQCFADTADGEPSPESVLENIDTFAATLVVAARRVIALKAARGVRQPMKYKQQTIHMNGDRSVRAILAVEKTDRRFVNAWLSQD